MTNDIPKSTRELIETYYSVYFVYFLVENLFFVHCIGDASLKKVCRELLELAEESWRAFDRDSCGEYYPYDDRERLYRVCKKQAKTFFEQFRDLHHDVSDL